MSDQINVLAQLLTYAHEMGATDMHVSAGLAPDVVVRGRLYQMPNAPVVAEGDLRAWNEKLCHTPGTLWEAEGASDGSATLGQMRVRLAFRRQQGGTALTARLLPLTPPRLADLQVPDAIGQLLDRPNGLVIVSGPTGAGKTTLLAALVNEVNMTQARHILTIEEPVEYLHGQHRSRISQREVGTDVNSFGAALRSAVRARPDIIVVGEMRDEDTARAALDAASKGHLVLTTSHAGSAAEALEGFVGLFPASEQAATAGRLASTLQAVVVQQLLPTREGEGLVPAREILLRTSGIASLVRQGSFQQVYNAIANTTESPGACRLEESLTALVARGIISLDVALAVANQREVLRATFGQRDAR